MSSFAKLVWVLLLTGLGTGGYLTYSQYNTQSQLSPVLQQLDATLTTHNAVPIGPDGAGVVRFRAPRPAGPASWVGRVRINQNGRDTTFVVRVPYRVARR